MKKNMNIFVIRNFFSILTAESIIKKFNIKKNIAVISGETEDYYMKIANFLNKRTWNEIIWEDSYKYRMINYINIRSLKKFIKLKEQEYGNLLEYRSVEKIFIVGPSFVDQNILLNQAVKRNIEINYYEEGMNLYINTEKIDKQIFKRLYKKFVKYILKDMSYVYDVKPFKDCTGSVYSILKYKDNITYKLSMDISYNFDKDLLKNTKYIYFSRPLSEDNLISELNELIIIEKLLTRIPNGERLFIKYHPRESNRKIKKIENIFSNNGITVVNGNNDFPGELILRYLNKDVKIFGHDGNILFYASVIFNHKVISLLDTDSQIGDYEYFSKLKDQMMVFTDNIEFI